jgi:hypothetical protein
MAGSIRYSTVRYRRNEDTSELKSTPSPKEISTVSTEMVRSRQQDENIRYPKQLLDYRLIGRRRPGRPLKRLLDGYSREAETGHLLA